MSSVTTPRESLQPKYGVEVIQFFIQWPESCFIISTKKWSHSQFHTRKLAYLRTIARRCTRRQRYEVVGAEEENARRAQTHARTLVRFLSCQSCWRFNGFCIRPLRLCAGIRSMQSQQQQHGGRKCMRACVDSTKPQEREAKKKKTIHSHPSQTEQ